MLGCVLKSEAILISLINLRLKLLIPKKRSPGGSCSKITEGEPSSVENMVDSIKISPPLRLNGSSNVQISNSFNELIPYAYDIEDIDHPGATLIEKSNEGDDSKKGKDDVVDDIAFDSPIFILSKEERSKDALQWKLPKGKI